MITQPASRKCPCCSKKQYEHCCRPLHIGNKSAVTPEQLMRSRYSAYVIHNVLYVHETWLPSTRPHALDLDESITWLYLEIVSSPKVQPEEREGYVEFIATYSLKQKVYALREKSVFKKENDTWFYVNGNSQLRKLSLSKKSLCPCQSGKKFKRCCGKL